MNWGKIMLSVDEFINYSDKYYAHIIQETSEEISRTETLTEHTKLCQKYFIMLAEDKKFDKIIKIYLIHRCLYISHYNKEEQSHEINGQSKTGCTCSSS